MARAYLLTGRPGVGKTTCLRRTLERVGVPPSSAAAAASLAYSA